MMDVVDAMKMIAIVIGPAAHTQRDLLDLTVRSGPPAPGSLPSADRLPTLKTLPSA